MLTLDAQIHPYERNYSERPWKGELAGPPSATGDEQIDAMDAVGVDGAVLVSPYSVYRYDASYLLDVYARHPGRFALVKPVDPTNPAVDDVIADWAATKGAVGIRLLLAYGAAKGSRRPRHEPHARRRGAALSPGESTVLGTARTGERAYRQKPRHSYRD
jgi:predicted TIM-barrel fold metal-dependent hydrolase